MAIRIVEIQPTPNPNAAKFILDHPVSDQSTSFFNVQAASGHRLAEQLFAIPGVTSLLLLGDFITINKSPQIRWADITPSVRSVLATEPLP